MILQTGTRKFLLFLYLFVFLFVIPVEKVCQINLKYIPFYEHNTDEKMTKIVKMS